MKIQRWHWGKILILWVWGGLVVSLLLTEFLSQKPAVDPAVSTVSFLGSMVILGALTVVTWIWLGGKQHTPTDGG